MQVVFGLGIRYNNLMHNPKLKERAVIMRKEGKSITSIAKLYGLNKTTVSYWCRDIKLPEYIIKKLETERKSKAAIALLRYGERNRANRIYRTQEEKMIGAKLFNNPLKKDLLFFGLGLYWGEGYKESNGELGFTNSNKVVIKFYLNWLQLWGVSKSDLIFRLTINNFFRKYERKIMDFWMDLLGVKEDQFSKTTIIKSVLKKGSLENMQNYNGILRVKVRRGLSLKNKILGAIDHIANY